MNLFDFILYYFSFLFVCLFFFFLCVLRLVYNRGSEIEMRRIENFAWMVIIRICMCVCMCVDDEY